MSLSIFIREKNLFDYIKKTVKNYFMNKNSFSGPETLVSSLLSGLQKKKKILKLIK